MISYFRIANKFPALIKGGPGEGCLLCFFNPHLTSPLIRGRNGEQRKIKTLSKIHPNRGSFQYIVYTWPFPLWIMNKFRKSLIPFLLIVFSLPLLAHDMYIRPHVDKKNVNRVSLAMVLQREEIVWFESMTANLRMNGPSGEANLTVPDEGDPFVDFDKPGTYEIGWESQPTFILVEPDIFKKYIALEGYSEAINSRKASNTEDQPGKEIYTRYIKTFIQIGASFTDHYNEPFGYKIEIIPLQNPCKLATDSDLEVKLLIDGQPMPNHKIFATYDEYSEDPADYAQVTLTDDKGIARFRLTHKGLWLIRTNQMIPLQNNPEADWQSFWANCTFEVK